MTGCEHNLNSKGAANEKYSTLLTTGFATIICTSLYKWAWKSQAGDTETLAALTYSMANTETDSSNQQNFVF